jgi:glycolate oxidase FAD binding subunit
LRDYVLGISAVNDEGKEFKAGGRVVKNVAGYDMCKLLVGSLGTLGIITQTTLKLRPRPEEQALVTLACESQTLDLLLDRLHASRTRPVCLDVLNLAALQALPPQALPSQPSAAWMVFVGFEGTAEAVKWQVQQLVKELGTGWGIEARFACTAAPSCHALAEFPAWPATLTVKANVLPHATAAFCRELALLPEQALVQAHAGNGIVVAHVPGELMLERAASLIQSVRMRAAAAGGSVVVLRCPAAWKQAISVWGAPRGDMALMRTIKDKLDPRRIFNPGRFVDGI